ncbi:MAG: Ig-like domain-containing protein [Anaerolineae bacterium]|nr:Ig-like domain-containing protein [Anaerolineae bacterium]
MGIGLFLASGILLTRPAVAQPHLQPPYPEGESEYFYSTGHYVSGPFLEFYRLHGEARTFGYPQTEVFYDAQSGLWVQYFDNVRMEWHPGNRDPYKVQLGLLAEILGRRYPAISSDQIPYGNPFRRYFSETGHVVSFAFLTFYDENGGLDVFGYPISEPMVENGRIVQYFQRARMEWHPERQRDERVVLGALGMEYIEQYGVPQSARERQQYIPRTQQPASSTAVSSLRVWPFVRNVITGREGEQTVYVYVTDQARQPVAGATASIAVHLPSQTVTYSAEPTDSRGITSVTFPITSLPPGRRIIVDVTVRLGTQVQTGQTFFVPWY